MYAYHAAVIGLAVGLALAPAPASAQLTSEPIAVGPFHGIKVAGHGDVVLVQGNEESVTVEGSPKSPAKVHVRSSQGRLTVTVREQRSSWGASSRAPTITIRFRTLESLALAGTIKVSAASIEAPALRIEAVGAPSVRIDDLKLDRLTFIGSGAVKADLSGRATEQDVRISGAGTLRAERLASQTAIVKVGGAGRVVVNAEKALDAHISGAGAIDYYGDPEVKQRVSGAGRITHRTEAAPARQRA
jgi:hypothetical protein